MSVTILANSSGSNSHNSHSNGNSVINNLDSCPKFCSYENGTLNGAVNNIAPQANPVLSIPQIVISRTLSKQSLNTRQHDDGVASQDEGEGEEEAEEEECAALLQSNGEQHNGHDDSREQQGSPRVEEDAEANIFNGTTSDSNVLESSIYSELQFTTTLANELQAQPTIRQSPNMIDGLSTRDARQVKRTRRQKSKTKPKCSGVTAGHTQTNTTVIGHPTTMGVPPRYTAIFLEPHQAHAANGIGPIGSLDGHVPHTAANNDGSNYMQQQYQYYQHRPLITTNIGHHHHHRLRNSFLETTNPQPPHVVGAIENATTITTAGAAPVMSDRRPVSFCVAFRKWFPRPSLPFVIGILALGGAACTLGGIVLGSTGLIEHSTQYLSAALLMIGIGVSLLVISGAIWRLSLPDDTDECPCFRHLESCRNCNSPYCNNHLLLSSFLYPEFQHRPPPPSYLTSLNECAAMGFLLHPGSHVNLNNVRVNTPPPLYRSTSSLRSNGPYAVPWRTIVPVPLTNSASNSTLSDRACRTRNNPPDDSVEIQSQTLTKEINYLELN